MNTLQKKIPVGILIPTFNCARLLPAHIESMRSWLDMVSEIVVVDSHSEDGSVEIIQKQISHPALRVLQHPRGLYQSWNFGISHIKSKYTYISTVGDSISRAGLEHLCGVVENFECDGVISMPQSITNEGAPMKDESFWPVHDVLTSLNIREPSKVDSIKLFFFAMLHIPNGILGSSASNLYRTEILQQHPFPTDFGITGDGAWALDKLFDSRWAVTPEVVSTFRHHPKAYSARTYAVDGLARKLFDRARHVFEKKSARDAVLRENAERLGLEQFLECAEKYFDARQNLEVMRGQQLPWILNPAAWRTRSEKKHLHRRMQAYKKMISETSPRV